MTRVIEHLDLNYTPLHNVDWSALIAEVQLACHPVGSLYWREDDTDPATLFGGTWTRIKDKFILAAGDTYAAGGTGGAATVTLTTAQMPSHTHPTLAGDASYPAGSSVVASFLVKQSWDYINSYSAGESQPHNNMPPYETYYCWKRTA